MENPVIPFARTICACPADQAGCHRQPGFLIPGDYDRIEAHLRHEGLTVWQIVQLFRASKGGVIADLPTGTLIRVPTITPARTATGACVFLEPTGHCAIHAIAPFGCAYFDVHMDNAEADRRSIWGLLACLKDEEYPRFRRHLTPADKEPPCPMP